MDPKNIRALSGLNILYSEHRFDFDRALELSLKRLEIERSIGAKASVAENYIEVGQYEKGRRYAVEAIHEAKDGDVDLQCLPQFLVLCSYLLSGEATNKEVTQFFDYYRNLKEDFRLDEPYWSFRGLIHFINKSNSNVQTKFLLATLIDLIQGRIDRQKLSFFQAM